MAKSAWIIITLGFVIGIAVGALVLVAVLSGANLFHGGHLKPIVNVLLPGLGIAERLPRGTPGYVFGALAITSALQFPFYGALAGHCYARRRLSVVAKLAIIAHAAGAAVAVAAAFLTSYG